MNEFTTAVAKTQRLEKQQQQQIVYQMLPQYDAHSDGKADDKVCSQVH